ncbi:unnamed protein product [Knipowitschia caucasica]
MQHNGSASPGPSLSFMPIASTSTRVRRFIQERRAQLPLPLPRVMVVFSAAGGDSSGDRAEGGIIPDLPSTSANPGPLPGTLPGPLPGPLSGTLPGTLSEPLSGPLSGPLPGPLPGTLSGTLPRNLSSVGEQEQEFPEILSLNVGGTYFTTRLSTLQRYDDTMLAAMFSGRYHIPQDSDGRYFIDRDGSYFGDVLNFLREGELPPQERVRAVYREAQYYSIGPLLEHLEDIQPLTGEKVRQAFLDLMPYYRENLERIMEIAKLRAMQKKARFAKLKVCVYKEEMPITPYERPLLHSLRLEQSDNKLFSHQCEVDVSFGPWEAVADVYDLLHCIVSDLGERGISAEQQCIGVCDKHLINHYYCKRPIYEFKITWW